MIKKSDKRWFHIKEVEQKFKEVCSKYITDEKVINKLFRTVLNAYCHKDRHYHDMYHIFHMVGLWESHKHLLKSPDEIFFAIIYHDIVYKPKRKDNEFRSADFFDDKVSIHLKGTNNKKIFNAIIATIHSDDIEYLNKHSLDVKYLLDFDLDVLSTRHKDTYEWYRKGVRKEYSMYPLKQYKAGRKAVLEKFLKRPVIYLTPEFEMLEKRARKNLKNEIKLYLC